MTTSGTKPKTGPRKSTTRLTTAEVLRRVVEARPGGEVREEQITFSEACEAALASEEHLIAQAPTGTGKTIGYSVAAIMSGKRGVISTATKQLGIQAVQQDLPQLQRAVPAAGGPSFTFALLMGRSNYACLAKIDELTRLDEMAPEASQASLFGDDPEPTAKAAPSSDDLRDLNALLRWVGETETGDRNDAPPHTDRAWSDISTDSAGCPGAGTCPFAADCFAEQARETAREADIVVTNHALLAQDLRAPMPILGERDYVIIDEAHEAESYMSSAWGAVLHIGAAQKTIAQAARKLPSSDSAAKNQATLAIDGLDVLLDMQTAIEPGILDELPRQVSKLMRDLITQINDVMLALVSAAERAQVAAQAGQMRGAAGKMAELSTTLTQIVTADDEDVLWLTKPEGNRPGSFTVEPLWVGPLLMSYLGDRTLIATSATLMVNDSFDAAIRTFGLAEDIRDPESGDALPPRPFRTIDVGSPFDYTKQVMLCVPDPASFPSPEFARRQEHQQAVFEALTSLVTSAGGRTLALFATAGAAKYAAEHLRATVATPVLAQGDKPAGQLIAAFTEDEHSTLCATLGFWHGVDVPGPSLSLVTMDKIPFAPADDPLMSARRRAAEKVGRDGFIEIYVNAAAIKLAQGFGRLIRTKSDRGAVVIFDTRLFTKRSYGPLLLRSLPQVRLWRDLSVICDALTRLTGGTPTHFAKSSRAHRPGATKAVSDKTTSASRARKAAPSRARTRAIGRPARGAKAS